MIQIENARKEDAPIIAPMIMEAMNLECCQWFAGPNHTLEEFEQLMTRLVAMEESQYSYRNTLVAIDHGAEAGRTVAGVCVSYDGALLRPLRRAFIKEALETFGIDYSDMGDETAAGELYIDTVCVRADYRGHGIAGQLLMATVEKGRGMGLPTGLLVDDGNPKAERLYRRLGFEVVGDDCWGATRCTGCAGSKTELKKSRNLHDGRLQLACWRM